MVSKGARLRAWAKRITLAAPVATVAAILSAIPAWAADDSDGLETVFVTARKQSEDVQKVPLPVTVLSGEDLSQSNDTQMQQLSLKAPDLLVTQSNARNAAFGMRGLGNNPTSDGLSSSVGVYMDGVYLDRPGMAMFDLIDVAQVEVLRGPQGTLFGKNTTAGAIAVTTKAPEFQFGAAGAIRLGDFGFRQVHLVVTGPLSDTLALRISAYDTDRGGYLKDIYDGRDLLSLHRQGVRGQLLYQPGTDLSWRLIGEYGREQDSSGAAVLYSKGPVQSASPNFVSYDSWVRNLGITTITDPNLLETTANAPQSVTERQYALTSLLTANLGPMTLDSVTGWRDWRYEPILDLDYTNADVLRNGGETDLEHQFSEELRLSGRFSAVHFVAGAYLFWRDLSGDAFMQYGSRYSQGLGILGNPALNNGITHTDIDISNRSYALFLQMAWNFAPQWNLTAGLRETYETESGTITRLPFTGGSGPPPPNLGAYDGSLSTAETTPSALLSLDYQISDTLMVYGMSAYGAKAGGFNPSVPTTSAGTILPAGSLRVKPEQMKDFELGLKSELLDRHLIVDFNGYWGWIADYQAASVQTFPNNQRQTAITNVGSVLSQGLEADVTAKLLSAIQFTSSLSYNDAHYVTFLNGPSVQGAATAVQNLSNRPLLLAPAWTAFAGVIYTYPLAPDISAFVEGQWMLKSSHYGYPDDSVYVRIPAANFENLQLGLTIERTDLALWVNNILDERSFAPVFPSATGAAGYMAIPSEPRTFGLSFRSSLD